MSDTEEPKRTKLTPRQFLFVQEYVKEMNGRKAARAAGYNGTDAVLDVTASKLLSSGKVKAAVEAALGDKRVRAEINADWFVKRLVKIIDFDPAQALDVDDSGTLKLKSDLPRGALRHFDSLSTSSASTRGAESDSDSRATSFKNRDRLSALELLAKLMGVTGGKQNDPGADHSALDRRISEALRKHSKQG